MIQMGDRSQIFINNFLPKISYCPRNLPQRTDRYSRPTPARFLSTTFCPKIAHCLHKLPYCRDLKDGQPLPKSFTCITWMNNEFIQQYILVKLLTFLGEVAGRAEDASWKPGTHFTGSKLLYNFTLNKYCLSSSKHNSYQPILKCLKDKRI